MGVTTQGHHKTINLLRQGLMEKESTKGKGKPILTLFL